MEKFLYKAKDDEGKTIKGAVEARDEKQAAQVIREKGLLVISLKKGQRGFATDVKGSVFARVGSSVKVSFTRQLSTMITAGLRVTEALEILEVQASPAMGRIVGEVLRDVEGGSSLAGALERHPEVFDEVYVALIRAGEAAGVLDKVLARLADNLEKQKEFRSRIKGAMIYPSIVIGGMVLVAAVMTMFVLPQMTTIYQEFQAELPLPTKILIAVSNFATHYWWLLIMLLVGFVFGFRVLSLNQEFRRKRDEFIFKLPVIGNLRKQVMLTEFTRIFGLLVGSGILIVDCLNIVSDSLQSPVYKQAVMDAKEEVEKGFPLASALARTGVFPPILSQMVSVGEETGKLDEVLTKVSTYFEQESEVAIKGLTTALEPLIMIVLGVGVGFLIIAIIMPIYNLTSQF